MFRLEYIFVFVLFPARKKGNLFATFNLESIPAETVLNPQLLDFIEQTLEPIPIVAVQSSLLKESQQAADEEKSETETAQSNYASSISHYLDERAHLENQIKSNIRLSVCCFIVTSVHH